MVPNGNWEKEFGTLNRKIDRLSATNGKLVSQVVSLSSQVSSQASLISEVNAQNKTQAQTIDKLSLTIDELKGLLAAKDAELVKLREQVNKDSTNSSKPSSTDFFNKPKPSAINKGGPSPAKKKNGGQQGHTGSTMKLKAEPDAVHACLPSECITCPHCESCKSRVAESRHVVDVHITSEQSRYDRIERICPKDGRTLSGSFPEGVKAPQQYGERLKALVVTLSSFGMVSASRISQMLEGMAGIGISDGTVCNIISDCANRCEPFIAGLKEKVIGSDVAHFDESGIRVSGKIHWAHTSSTEQVTLISAHRKRGVDGIVAAGVLSQFGGIAVSDCWGSYFNDEFSLATHAVCGAHIDRELEGAIQNTKQKWARSMQKLLGDMYDAKRRLIEDGHAKAPDPVIDDYSARYDLILERAFSRNPFQAPKEKKRGRPKKPKVRNLIERLKELKDAVLRFFTDFRVPFSNNVAERSFRLCKQKTKVVGSFRSADGGANFCSIYSIIDTVRKNGGNPFDSLVRLFNNSFSLDFLS